MDKSTYISLESPTVTQQLIQLIRKHLKLALDHGQPSTTKERRESIRNEINALRIERDHLLLLQSIERSESSESNE